MKKLQPVTWEEIYRYWEVYARDMAGMGQMQNDLKEIHVDYERGIFYGYDWLSQNEYVHREDLIRNNPTSFLLFTKPSNKGTIHTIQMLMEAQDEEEWTAIWICAFTKELMERVTGDNHRIANQIHQESWKFLSERFYMWHHAMKRLIPEILFNYSLCSEIEHRSYESIVELARINTILTMNEYIPILYSSLQPGERTKEYSLRRHCQHIPKE